AKFMILVVRWPTSTKRAASIGAVRFRIFLICRGFLFLMSVTLVVVDLNMFGIHISSGLSSNRLKLSALILFQGITGLSWEAPLPVTVIGWTGGGRVVTGAVVTVSRMKRSIRLLWVTITVV